MKRLTKTVVIAMFILVIGLLTGASTASAERITITFDNASGDVQGIYTEKGVSVIPWASTRSSQRT